METIIVKYKVWLKTAAYQAAVSTRFGLENSSAQDFFSLKRVGIHNDISSTMPLFAYRIAKSRGQRA